MNGKIGAHYSEDGRSRFTVWAPFADQVDLHITSPGDRLIALEKQDKGYYETAVEGIEPGSLYVYRLNEGTERPDPASFSQPRGTTNDGAVLRFSRTLSMKSTWELFPGKALLRR